MTPAAVHSPECWRRQDTGLGGCWCHALAGAVLIPRPPAPCRHPRSAWVDRPNRNPDGTVTRTCAKCGRTWSAAGRVTK